MPSPVSSAVHFFDDDNNPYHDVNTTKTSKQQALLPKSSRDYVGATLIKNGMRYYSYGQTDRALEQFGSALRTQTNALGRNHPIVAQTLGNMGSLYLERGDLDSATDVLSEALRIKLQTSRNTLTKDDCIASVLNNLGNLCFLRGLYEDAIKYYQSALDIRKELSKHNTRNQPYVADILHNMGRVYCSKNEIDLAMSTLAESLYITRKSLGEDHIKAADTLEKIGALYLHKQMYDEAMEAFNEVLRVTTTALGAGHADIAPSLHNIAIVHRERGELERAKDVFTRALDIYMQTGYRNDHRCVITVRRNISTVERLISMHRI